MIEEIAIERFEAAIRELSQPRGVAIVLLTGFAALAMSLLVIMRTRWGQVRPLSKCIGLSVFAHLLLIGCAYTTDFFSPPATAVEPAPIRIALASDDSDRLAELPQERFWERPQEERVTSPELASAPRSEVSWSLDEARSDTLTDPAPSQLATSLAPLAAPLDSPARPEPPAPDLDSLRIQQPSPAAPVEERPAPAMAAPTPQATPALPSAAPLRRPGLPESSLPDPAPPQRRADAEALDPAALARLPDLARQVELAEAASGPESLVRSQPTDSANAAKSPGQGDAAMQFTAGATPRLGDAAERQGLSSGVAAALAAPAPKRLGDGAPLPEIYRARVEGRRQQIGAMLGATPQSEAAVERALQWLARNQGPDGRWIASQHGAGREERVLGHDRAGAGARADTAITGLALLALLGAGHTHLEGDFRQNVRRALEFLLAAQAADGNLAGEADLYARMYCHGIASLALSEALSITGDPALRGPVERAVRYSVAAQHPTKGGWRYQPGDEGDTSQFGWQVMALTSAELAGVEVPASTRRRMEIFLESVCRGQHGGLASYRPGQAITRSMTAEALVCRYFLEHGCSAATHEEAAQVILQEPPQAGKANLYYWYYATLALFPGQDEAWRQWSQALQEQLLARQRLEGADAGSWDTNTVWGGYGGRVYTTAMAALCLEVYYRYLPTHQLMR